MNIEEAIEQFKIDNVVGLYKFTSEVVDYINANTYSYMNVIKLNDDNDIFILDLMDKYGLLFSMLNQMGEEEIYKITGNFEEDLSPVCRMFYSTHNKSKKKVNELNFINSSNKYNSLLTDEFMYHFSENEIEKIQKSINILREEISKSTLFEEEHKQRLLSRLEKLQSEIHKKMSDLDRFWGLVGDAGVALGKFGKDAKPIVDRIKELTDIVWGAQRRAEKLPDNTSTNPLLDDES